MTALDVMSAGVVLYGLLGLAVLAWYLVEVCGTLQEPADPLEMATVLVEWPCVVALAVRLWLEKR